MLSRAKKPYDGPVATRGGTSCIVFVAKSVADVVARCVAGSEIVLRGCLNNFWVQVPDISNDCVHGIMNYTNEGLSVQANATVCPCTTDYCNAGDIELGGSAGTVTPPNGGSVNHIVLISPNSIIPTSP